MVFKYLGLYLITIEQNSGQIQLISGVYCASEIAEEIFLLLFLEEQENVTVYQCVYCNCY